MSKNEKTKDTFNTKSMTFVGIMAALLCVAGPLSIPIPFSPVPISFTNFAIYIAAILVGWKITTLSTVIYMLLGLVGLPVFSGFGSGIGKFFGPTGGYLIGFIFVAIICGLTAEKTQNKLFMGLGFCISLIVVYLFGTVWLAIQMHLSFSQALMAGVIPYIPGDIVKIIVAVLVFPPVKRRLYQSGIMV